MGKFTIISQVSESLLTLLRKELVPDLILNPEKIALCSPENREDAALGIYLYDMDMDENFQTWEMQNVSVSRQKYPPMHLALCYMVTAYSSGDLQSKALEEQKIMGRAMQVLKDFSVLNEETLMPVSVQTGGNIRIQMQSLSIEEKKAIWNTQKQPYQLSMFYRVAPIALESTRSKDVQRVMTTEFRIGEGDGK